MLVAALLPAAGNVERRKNTVFLFDGFARELPVRGSTHVLLFHIIVRERFLEGLLRHGVLEAVM